MISGYKTIQLLHESKRFKIVRALRIEDNVNVILKLSVQEPLTKKDLKKFSDEYSHATQVDSDYVVKYYDSYEYSPNKWVFIQEDIGGVNLAKSIPANGFAVEVFLKIIAPQIVLGLEAIHCKGIIHKDIKPSNIAINIDLGLVKIFDFSSSIQLKQEKQLKTEFSHEAVTLAYISPEQTGYINRNIDYRTDFYSLGVTFYELLTGKLPFRGSDDMSIIHQHIAKQPTELHKIKEAIPLFLSHIVSKLLAKNPEERYQSCQGILYDLKRCLDAMQTGSTIPLAELGKQDFPEVFIIPQTLYDREKEIAILFKTFERSSEDKAEALMVTGHAGIGKTKLINEIQKPLTLKRGYFIAGKFDQLNRSTAYSAIIQAFQELMRQLLTECEERFNYWKEKLCNAVGPNGQLIIDVIPELERVIGKQPAVPALGCTEAKNRFNLVFKNFISVFTQKEHPLVLFLDDLQWADFASLELIKLFLDDPETQYFLLIGAYRDNEVDALHPLALALEELKKSHITIQQITLVPLDLLNVTRWLADTTGALLEDVGPLAELVYQKTQGNPFFIKVFLQALYDEKLLVITAKTYHWDLQRISKRQVTDNVVEFMVSRIEQFPKQTQQLLSLISCFGYQVGFSLLTIVAKKNNEQLLEDLKSVFDMGMIYQDGESICFAHGRIQEAAYSLLSSENKKKIHLSIGRVMLKKYSTQAELLFDMVDHFNKSQELLQDSQERVQLTRLNLDAGIKAKNAIAYRAALNYLNASLVYLKNRNIWMEDYPLAFALYKEIAEVEYLNGNFEKSYSLIQQMETFIKDPIDMAEINILLLIQKTLQCNYQEAINVGRQSLKQLHVELPEVELKLHIQNELARILEQLQDCDIYSLLALPTMVDPEKIAVMKLLFNLLGTSYIANPDLFFIIGLKMVSLSLQYGQILEACTGYSICGTLLCTQEKKYQLGYAFADLGLKLCDKFHSAMGKCHVIGVFLAFIYHWTKPVSLTRKLAEEGFQAGLESGNLHFAGYIIPGIFLRSYYQGNFLSDIALESNERIVFVEKTKNQVSIDITKSIQLAVNYLRNPLSTCDRVMDNSDFELSCIEHKSFFALCLYHILKAHVSYLMRRYTQALDSIFDAQKNIGYASGFVINATYNAYYSLSLIKLYPNQNEEKQKEYLLQIESNQNQLLSWANSCPQNFLHHYMLVEAEIASIKNKPWEALQLYNQAIELAHESKFIQDEALTNELVAEFCNANGQKQLAKDYMQKAYALYQYWGAVAKMQQLENTYPHLFSVVAIPKVFESLVSSTTESYLNLDRLNLQTVIKASQIISSEVDLNKFLQTMMATILENSGAEKVTFFSVDEAHITAMAQAQEQLFDAQSLPLSDWKNGSLSVIRYVGRTKELMVVDNAFEDSKFKVDAYIQEQQTKSILCMPIIIKDVLKAILYLENNHTSHAFTPNHVEILTILTNQIAISLEKTNLYEVVRKNEQRYRMLVETAHALVWSASNEGCFITSQVMWEQFTGQTWEQSQGLGWMNVIHVDDRERIIADFSQGAISKKYFHELVRLWSRDGYYKYLIMHVVPLINAANEITEWMGTCLDVHELKRTEERLRVMTSDLSLALSSANIGTWSWNLVNNRLDIDENMFAMYDIDPSDYHNALAEAFKSIHPDDRERIDSLIKHCIAQNVPYEAEFRIVKKDGTIHYLLGRGKVYYEDKKPIRMTGVSWDITLEKERQHLQTVIEYQQRLVEFIDTLCHELRNPLTGIYGSTDLLRNIIDVIENLLFLNDSYANFDSMLVEKLRDNFKQAKEQLDGLDLCMRQQKAILDDVLDLSKLDADKIILVPAPFSLKALIRSLIQIINPQAVQKNIKIEIMLPEGDCLLKADSHRLSQIIINLLTNAIKFTKAGSITVIATIKSLPAQEALLSIVVKDTGIGMSPGEKSKLFERFSQIHKEPHQYGGAGLGLFICKKLVEKMSGSIEVESEKGRGSKFSVTIKCHSLTDQEQKEFYSTTTMEVLAQKEEFIIKNKIILVVEDNIINQKILVRFLEKMGGVCQIANDGIEALEKCEGFCFDIIFMDIEMPRMNGLDATRQLRAKAVNKNSKTLIFGVSGNASEAHKQRALQAGMDEYLTKPYHQKDIQALLTKYFSARSAVSPKQIEPSKEELIIPTGAKKRKSTKYERKRIKDNSEAANIIIKNAINATLGRWQVYGCAFVPEEEQQQAIQIILSVFHDRKIRSDEYLLLERVISAAIHRQSSWYVCFNKIYSIDVDQAEFIAQLQRIHDQKKLSAHVLQA